MSGARPKERKPQARKKKNGSSSSIASDQPPTGLYSYGYGHDYHYFTPTSVPGPTQQPGVSIVPHVVARLCEYGGTAKVGKFSRYLRDDDLCRQLNASSLENLLGQNPQNFNLQRWADGGSTVTVHTDLKICSSHCTEAGCRDPSCDSLHVCKYFMISICKAEKKGGSCNFGHDYQTPHNWRLMMRHGLGLLCIQDLQVVFRINRCEATLPMACRFYNNAGGCKHPGGGAGCPGMHVCRPYLQDQCKFGTRCKRSHNIFDPQPRAILLQYGFDVERSPKEVLAELRQVCATKDGGARARHPSGNALPSAAAMHLPPSSQPEKFVKPKKMAAMMTSPSTNQQPDGPGAEAELQICMYHLQGKCLFASKCRNYHATAHYQWQRQHVDGKTWVDMKTGDNTETELNYSDPSKDDCFLGDPARVCKVDFISMVLTEAGNPPVDVRRLGTSSSVLAPPTKLHRTTEWMWYWTDSTGKWVEYGEPDSNESYRSTLTSKAIEEQYQENHCGVLPFSTSDHKYQLDFSKMVQKNITIGTKRCVRRRPVFNKDENYGAKSSVQDILAALNNLKKRLDDSTSRSRQSSDSFIPGHWDLDHESENDYYQLVPVVNSGTTLQEYKQVEQLFLQTMSGKSVKCVKRIQNLDLWEKFQRKKIKMERKLSNGETLGERQLFHGTNRQYIDAICQQGFEWRVCGSSVGTMYGKGSYFAKKASYSQSYTDCRSLFVVRVLVGQHVKGTSALMLPPPRDASLPQGERYDSCVDKMSDPEIFVIFKEEQSYPEYIIEY